jgi:glycosyltransferase involved in cell wall biosynthesis
VKKILIEGPLLTQSGYGEHSRFVLRALMQRADVDIYVHPLAWGTTSWLADDTPERRKMDELVQKTTSYTIQSGNNPQYDVHIHIGIPSEFNKKAPLSIHVTAGIETTKISPAWLQKTFEMDKIIVPSEHSKWAFENTSVEVEDEGRRFGVTCKTPIEVIPYPAKVIEPDKNFNLNLDYEFNFLSVAMWGPRKNMENMIRWFLDEFKNEEVGLVLKTGMSRGSLLDKRMTEFKIKNIMESVPEKKCKVYLLHGDLTEAEMTSLYTHKKIKAMVSATHGEGFGLPLFEAATNAMPVIAPAWSGQIDFLRAPVVMTGKVKKTKMKDLYAKVDFTMQPIQREAVWKDILVEDSMWCYPKEKSFKTQIRNVFKNYGMYKSWAKKLQKHILSEFEERKMFDRMNHSLLGKEQEISVEEQLAALTIRKFE